MEFINVDPDRCILCGSCEEVCVRRIFTVTGSALTLTSPESCILCGHCKAVCPADAVNLPALDAEEFIPAPEKTDLPNPDMLMNLFRARRSTRVYKDAPVEKEKLEQIIQAGRFAPTGGNLQAQRYIVVHTPEKMNHIRGLAIHALARQAREMEAAMAASPQDRLAGNRMMTYMQMFKKAEEDYQNGIDRILWNAPALIVIHVSRLVENPGVDVGLAGMQMALMAESLGLGSCFIGMIVMAANQSAELRQALLLPENHQMVTSLVCGYPDVSYSRLVSRNKAKVRWL